MTFQSRPRRTSPLRAPRAQSGMSMIEVLVAVVVLAFGLLGISAMQMTSLRSSQSSLERSQAIAQSYAMFDAMRANRQAALIGRYDIPMSCDAPDPGNLVANDLAHWITSMQQPQVLGPSACGSITCNSTSCTITVRWDDSRRNGGSSAQSVVTKTVL